MSVPKKYEGRILGKGGNNKENIETKSGAQIILLSRHNSEGRLICKNVFVYIAHTQTQKCLFSVFMKEPDETQIFTELKIKDGEADIGGINKLLQFETF